DRPLSRVVDGELLVSVDRLLVGHWGVLVSCRRPFVSGMRTRTLTWVEYPSRDCSNRERRVCMRWGLVPMQRRAVGLVAVREAARFDTPGPASHSPSRLRI